VTWAGLDVHARSTHAAAIDTLTGELTRVRFGPGVDAPAEWLRRLPGPVKACYEAGPTGFGLYGATLRNRQHGQPDHVLQIANRAQQRLYRVHQRMRAGGKPGNVTAVAAARELACFLWAAATAD
jgi:hypothetical protein